jgi:hypothetical protein
VRPCAFIDVDQMHIVLAALAHAVVVIREQTR